MLARLTCFLSALILIAVFAFLFKFSIPEIKEFFIKQDSKDLIDIKLGRFFNRLTFEDIEAIRKMPCTNNNVDNCKRLPNIVKILEDERKNSSINYFSIFNGNGYNLFDGTKLAEKYTAMLNIAKTSKFSIFVDRGFGNGDSLKVVYIKNIGKSDQKILLNNVYSIAIIESAKLPVNQTVFCLIIGISFVLPFLYFIMFFVKNAKSSSELVERYESENENLLKEIDRLKRENIQQANFLANFTHELRTPLNSIIGFSGLLKDQTLGNLGNNEYVKYSSDINTAGVHLLSLINDILDYTKAEVGRLKVNITEVDIVKVVKQCMAIVAPRASESGVELLQSISESHLVLRLDQKRIKQIVLNLLSNSVKFTPEGGSVTISLFPDIKGERMYIEVKDTGVGIAEQDIPTVMSLFGQVDSDVNRKYEGTGIGLPFSKKLTNMMGGTFELSSKVGVGTRITLGFPFDKRLNAEFLEMINPKG
jgi:signal transduction histidine kinase